MREKSLRIEFNGISSKLIICKGEKKNWEHVDFVSVEGEKHFYARSWGERWARRSIQKHIECEEIVHSFWFVFSHDIWWIQIHNTSDKHSRASKRQLHLQPPPCFSSSHTIHFLQHSINCQKTNIEWNNKITSSRFPCVPTISALHHQISHFS